MTGESMRSAEGVETTDPSDMELKVAAAVLNKLQTIAGESQTGMPKLREAADLAFQIITTVEKANGSYHELETLATDVGYLVYVISHDGQNVDANVSAELMESFDHVIAVLLEIKEFAEKSAGKKRLSALFSTLLQTKLAARIQHYRQELQQCSSRFGTSIDLKVRVYNLVAREGRMPNLPVNANDAELDSGSSPGPDLSITSDTMNASPTGGNLETNRTDPDKERMGDAIRNMNTTTVSDGTGQRVKHDNSVHFGEGINFAGAYGFNFGGSPSVTWNINRPS